MSLSFVRPTVVHPAVSTRRTIRDRRPRPLTVNQLAWLRIVSAYDSSDGLPVPNEAMDVTQGGRWGLFGDRREFSELTDSGLIDLVEVLRLTLEDGTPCLGVIRITDAGGEALTAGRLPARLPDLDWGPEYPKDPWVDRTHRATSFLTPRRLLAFIKDGRVVASR
jgi:hypothetical protein